MITTEEVHCVKNVPIRSYFWSVFSCIQFEYKKIQTRNNFVFGNFSRSRLFRTQLNTKDGAFCEKIIFTKKLHRRGSTGFYLTSDLMFSSHQRISETRHILQFHHNLLAAILCYFIPFNSLISVIKYNFFLIFKNEP